MLIGLLLVLVLVIFLLGGFSGRFGGSDYGHGGVGLLAPYLRIPTKSPVGSDFISPGIPR